MKKIATPLLLLMITYGSIAQSSLSFYHLGDATFQSSHLNPAFIPDDKIMFGLPAMSGIHVNFNNKLNYSELITKTESTQEVDLNKALSNLQSKNMLSTHASISLFHFALNTKSGGAFSIFANERIEADLLYSEPFMRVIAKGNAVALDEEIRLDDTRMAASYFREIGIGYALRNDNLGLKMGARLKYYQGFANASTPEKMTATLETNGETYAISAELENAILRSSGLNILDGSTGDLGSHLIGNTNRGFGVDLGFTLDMNSYSSIAASITDVGFISWKEDVENRGLSDTTFFYDGINLVGVRELEDEIQDSLINKFDIKTTTGESYTSLVGPRAYLSYIYKTRRGGDIISTVGARYIQTQMKVLLGLGYRKKFGKWFTGTVNVTRLPQQLFNLGAAVAVKGGPVQFYLAADQIGHWDMTKFEAFDVRVGINFVINDRDKSTKDNRGGSSPYFSKLTNKHNKSKGTRKGQSFLGNPTKVKAVDGIYNIIPKQKRRSLKEINSGPSNESKNEEYYPKNNSASSSRDDN